MNKLSQPSKNNDHSKIASESHKKNYKNVNSDHTTQPLIWNILIEEQMIILNQVRKADIPSHLQGEMDEKGGSC